MKFIQKTKLKTLLEFDGKDCGAIQDRRRDLKQETNLRVSLHLFMCFVQRWRFIFETFKYGTYD